DHRYRVHSECTSIAEMEHVSWFVLPPIQEYYYRFRNLSYRALPPYRSDCQPTTATAAMDLLYPHENSRIFVPRELNGEPGSSIFELAHRRPNTEVYWHLDGQYLG